MVSTAPKKAEKTPDTEATVRLTVAQATVRFLGNQYVEHDGGIALEYLPPYAPDLNPAGASSSALVRIRQPHSSRFQLVQLQALS